MSNVACVGDPRPSLVPFLVACGPCLGRTSVRCVRADALASRVHAATCAHQAYTLDLARRILILRELITARYGLLNTPVAPARLISATECLPV